MKAPKGYKIGRPWYSYDDGKTWTRKFRVVKELRGYAFKVTSVDEKNGVVTISAVIS